MIRAVLIAIALLLAMPAAAADVSLTIRGEVERRLTLSLDDLKQMEQTKVRVRYQTHSGTEAATFSGVLLWNLLEQAQLSDDGEKSSMLRRVVRVEGRDGYSIVLAAGEIAPDFEGKRVIIALAKNGMPLGDDGLRLVVPGDKRGGRSVRDVVRIVVR